MNNNTKIILLLILPLLLCEQGLHAYYFRKIGPAQGLDQPAVLAIYEDTLGRMWFGTRGGVYLYDGIAAHSFRPETAGMQENGSRYLTGNEVSRIVGDRNGDIFIRSEHSLVKYDIRQETFDMIRPDRVGALSTFNGNAWYTAGDSLFMYDAATGSEKFMRKLGIPDIFCLLIEDGKLWAGTPRGLYLSEGCGPLRNLLPGVEIYSLFKSSRNELWIASRMNGLYSIRRDGVLRKEPYGKDKVASRQIREFAEDEDQNIWFGTFEGLQVYNPYSDEYMTIRSDSSLPGTLSHPSVFSLCRDRHNTIWVGTYYGGVNYVNPTRDIFKYHVVADGRDDCLNYPIVGQMVEDVHRRLWICTDGGGLNRLDRRTGEFAYFRASDRNSVRHDNVKTIAYDGSRDVLYIGTHTGGMSRYDGRTGKFYNYPDRPEEGPGNIIYCMLFHEDRLYVSARNGIWILDPDTDSFELLLSYGPVLTFDIDSHGIMWMADRTGLLRMDPDDPGEPERVRTDSSDVSCRVTRIIESASGLVYIATSGQGVKVYDYETDRFRTLSRQENNLASNYCYNLMETSRNSILITTDAGLTLYSPFTGRGRPVGKTDVFAIGDGGGMYECLDNQIFIGGMNGMVSFDESVLYGDSADDASIFFSELYVNNARVFPADASGILAKSLPFTGELRLSADQNNLSIVFAVSDYVSWPDKGKYFYKLEGFDSDWNSAAANSLNYTNLPPGKYVLKVRSGVGAADDGPYGELSVTVEKPYYSRWWAWILYASCLAVLCFAIYRIRRNRREWADTLRKEKEEKSRIEELNKVKLRFFTDVSHEFKTPLTLITGQIESLLQSETFSPQVARRLERVRINAVRLKRLISELLDFRKQEQGFMKLKVEQLDLVDFSYDIWQVFEEYARTRHITYLFEPVEKNIEVWLDPVQMQKVISNLLSNAFKYTPDGGRIELRVRRMLQMAELSVSDSGRGISEEDKKHIFERFYRSGDEYAVSGAGIGLALSMGIVKAHKGSLEAEGEPGKGSVFTLKLLLGNDHFSHEELGHSRTGYSIDGDYAEIIQAGALPADTGTCQNTAGAEDKPAILIVDDDLEMLEMLEQIFTPSYRVYKATDGQDGLAMTSELIPDLVLSDLMMPGISGKELCRRIKTNLELSYIPVVLLTASDSMEEKVMGYIYGADDYIQKPFNVKLLLARCDNLVKNRRILLGRKETLSSPAPLSEGLSASDRTVVEKAAAIVRRNFDNSDFSMDGLAAELNMSRTKMFSFFKAALGITPNDFTLNLKMEEAARMLVGTPDTNISEISYALGFSSPRYFSRCFKAYYNLSPQQYRKNGGRR